MIDHPFDVLMDDQDIVAKSLEHAAGLLEEEAMILRRKASRYRRSKRAIMKARRRLKSIPGALRTARKSLANDPIGRVADELELPRATIEYYDAFYRKADAFYRKAEEGRSREQRDRRIVALASKGWTNREIARKYGLHWRTIQNVISKSAKRHHVLD